jgi:hypothetical protein
LRSTFRTIHIYAGILHSLSFLTRCLSESSSRPSVQQILSGRRRVLLPDESCAWLTHSDVSPLFPKRTFQKYSIHVRQYLCASRFNQQFTICERVQFKYLHKRSLQKLGVQSIRRYIRHTGRLSRRSSPPPWCEVQLSGLPKS